jgi:hypothetical protein
MFPRPAPSLGRGFFCTATKKEIQPMKIYVLHTNEGVRYVRSTESRMREAMKKYIWAKRSEGYTLASIVFCWSPLPIGLI